LRRIAALQLGWLTQQSRAALRFERAAVQPERQLARQWRTLQPVLAGSVRGRELGLDRARSVADLPQLPVMEPDELGPYSERIAAGEPSVLSAEPVQMLEPTSGGSGPRKLIPYTARLRREFAEAVGVWMVDLHRRRPGLLGTRSYWSISRAVRREERTAGGVPIGMPSDSAYFDPISRWVIDQLMAVDGRVASAPSMEAWRWQTLLQLVSCRELGLISVWSPSFLTQLLAALDTQVPTLLPELGLEARARLSAAWDGERVEIASLWPRLQLVSAWGDSFAARLLPTLKARLGEIEVQPKGVLATEGVVSIPLGEGPGHVLATTSHLIELRCVHTGRVCWPHQAELGGEYQALLSTGGGLLRYALPDRLQVVGWYGAIPRVRLLGRLDRVSDRVGEKLNPAFVQQVFSELWPQPPEFAMLLPRPEVLGYTLVCSEPVSAEAIDAQLCQAYHYRYARELGQLEPVQVQHRPDAWARWERGIEALGARLGDQKPEAIETRPELVQVLLGD